MKHQYWLRLLFPSWEFFSNVPFRLSVEIYRHGEWSVITGQKHHVSLWNLIWNPIISFAYQFQTLNHRLFLEFMDTCEDAPNTANNFRSKSGVCEISNAELQKMIGKLPRLPSWILMNVYCQRMGGVEKIKWQVELDCEKFEIQFPLDSMDEMKFEPKVTSGRANK